MFTDNDLRAARKAFLSEGITVLRRHLLGLTAIASFVLGAASFYWLTGERAAVYGDGCLKVGVMLSVLWLAFDELERLPGWMLVSFPGLLFVLIFSRKWFFILMPLVVLLTILRPRRRRG